MSEFVGDVRTAGGVGDDACDELEFADVAEQVPGWAGRDVEAVGTGERPVPAGVVTKASCAMRGGGQIPFRWSDGDGVQVAQDHATVACAQEVAGVGVAVDDRVRQGPFDLVK